MQFTSKYSLVSLLNEQNINQKYKHISMDNFFLLVSLLENS